MPDIVVIGSFLSLALVAIAARGSFNRATGAEPSCQMSHIEMAPPTTGKFNNTVYSKMIMRR